ncbi:hypothetical protein B6N60_03364 [Richelia sinica FACHB-800]|uniref:ATP-binding protein n=1 Tax=Richelia sinica FACHB-800 TaxID=1357546 RepID=A0A975Y5W7_9NOST|nr:ATP-binding protein [Richelia sinica]MBD2663472.1 ATP-binding protein [Richelia sinica FACHB-800]QXE24657.1 hypothetical protein B6N60_03364 [Richelia sinica FACHB-800]
MAQIFGNFINDLPVSDEYLVISFSPNSVARNHRWINYGLSADFLGDYFANFFPGEEIPNSYINRQDTVKASISYVANELLENAMKFSDTSANVPVNISLHLYENQLFILVSNVSEKSVVHTYQLFIEKIINLPIQDLYIQQLESTASNSQVSHMGLLTLIHDYEVDFGWKFEPLAAEKQFIKVNVMANLKF